MKNLHQFSPYEERQRRYPFLAAIDLVFNLLLSGAALALTVIALTMVFDTVLPTIARLAGF